MASYCSSFKKYPLGEDFDKEEVFNFNYIFDDDTVSFLKNHGRIMFIIRGLPGTGKATLGDMIAEKYPSNLYCCADHFFTRCTLNERNRDSTKASHKYCQNRAKNGCEKNKSPIIIQNTHIKKWEVQYYLNLAATYNYAIIMAETTYRFEFTPKSLEQNNTDGLSSEYFLKRMNAWVDIMPNFTGWFLCPQDSSFLLNLVEKTLEALLGDGKFCSAFDVYNMDDVLTYFKARRLLCCLATHSNDFEVMKKYYFSDKVQESYGKSFKITIIGYLIASSGITGIVHVSEEMKPLIEKNMHGYGDFYHDIINNNIIEYSNIIPFPNETICAKTASLKNWEENEDMNFSDCSLIDVAVKADTAFDFKLLEQFASLIATMDADDNQIMELENEVTSYRLPNNKWLIKAPQKVILQTIFTGLYT